MVVVELVCVCVCVCGGSGGCAAAAPTKHSELTHTLSALDP
jgi:hypothetical protein